MMKRRPSFRIKKKRFKKKNCERSLLISAWFAVENYTSPNVLTENCFWIIIIILVLFEVLVSSSAYILQSSFWVALQIIAVFIVDWDIKRDFFLFCFVTREPLMRAFNSFPLEYVIQLKRKIQVLYQKGTFPPL